MHAFWQGWEVIMTNNLINPRSPTGSARDKQSATRATTPNTLLQAARHRHGWTQQALADQLGTTPLAINRWEQGKAAPSAYFRTRLCDLFGLTTQELGLALRESPESLSPRPALWLVPYRRNPFFTGRDEILEHLHGLLAQDQPGAVAHAYALCGLGGIGKTQTALEYCYRYGEDYQAVFWLRAETRELLLADMLTIADHLGLASRHEPEQLKVVEAVKRWLKKHPSWLWVLDNVEDFALLEEGLPAECAGQVLLTTRSQFTGTVAQRIDLPRMVQEEGIRFVLRRGKLLPPGEPLETVAQGQWQAARTIVEMLDGLPLALDQVAAYLEETGCGLEDYLQRYEQHRLALLQRRGRWSSEHPHSVVATVELTCQQVGQVDPAALDLLSLCAFLHTDAIPEEILTEGQAHLGPVLQAMAADPYRLDEAIGTLRAYSLLQREVQQKLLTMHRLVQAVLRDRLSGEEQQLWVERLIRALHEVFPADALQETVEYWQRCEHLLPHALEELTLSAQRQIAIPEVAGLLTSTATYLCQRARYSEAEPLYQRALQVQEQTLGPEHPQVAWSLYGLADLCSYQGRYSEAEPLYRRALQLREQALGLEHPRVASVLTGLAFLYNALGRYSEAEPLLQRTLHIGEQARDQSTLVRHGR
jgi:transcriptional regulator with XRE-family HTH domain/tetratricopeptide (TPR) repeat protein